MRPSEHFQSSCEHQRMQGEGTAPTWGLILAQTGIARARAKDSPPRAAPGCWKVRLGPKQVPSGQPSDLPTGAARREKRNWAGRVRSPVGSQVSSLCGPPPYPHTWASRDAGTQRHRSRGKGGGSKWNRALSTAARARGQPHTAGLLSAPFHARSAAEPDNCFVTLGCNFPVWAVLGTTALNMGLSVCLSHPRSGGTQAPAAGP